MTAGENAAPLPRADAWNWSNPSLGYPGHVHIRREGREVVLIVTGNAGGSIAGKLGGMRMPSAKAADLARFILDGEDRG